MEVERIDIANDFQVRYDNLRQENQNKFKELLTQNQKMLDQQKVWYEQQKQDYMKRKNAECNDYMTVIDKQKVEIASIYDKAKKLKTLVEQKKNTLAKLESVIAERD